MVAIKAQQAPSFLKSMPKEIEAVLVHGTDPGLVSELARTAAERLAARDQPPGEILRIEDADLETDPDRIGVELRTMPMFGGRQVVRTTVSRKITIRMLEPLLEPGALSGYLVVEAGNLKADDAVRKAFEKAPHAAAIVCYADEARDIDGLISQTMRAAGISLDQDARTLLASRLGADRAMTRSELEKLVIYAYGRDRLELDDIEAAVGDASEMATDTILNGTTTARPQKALDMLDRALASGESAQGLILAVQRHFQRLDRVRAGLDGGASFEEAARALRPPLHFKQKTAFEGQVRAWSRDRLVKALSLIDKAARDARRVSAMDALLLEHLLLDLSRLAPQPAAKR